MLIPFIVLILVFIAVIAFLIFAARKKNEGQDLGETGKKL